MIKGLLLLWSRIARMTIKGLLLLWSGMMIKGFLLLWFGIAQMMIKGLLLLWSGIEMSIKGFLLLWYGIEMSIKGLLLLWSRIEMSITGLLYFNLKLCLQKVKIWGQTLNYKSIWFHCSWDVWSSFVPSWLELCQEKFDWFLVVLWKRFDLGIGNLKFWIWNLKLERKTKINLLKIGELLSIL